MISKRNKFYHHADDILTEDFIMDAIECIKDSLQDTSSFVIDLRFEDIKNICAENDIYDPQRTTPDFNSCLWCYGFIDE